MRPLGLKFVVAVIALCAWTTSAQAAPAPTPLACDISQVTESTACQGFDGPNDSTSFMNSNSVLGVSDWILSDKSDNPVANPVIDLLMTGQGTTSGTWSVDGGFQGYSTVALILKAGNAFVAYLLDTTETSGTWTTEGVLMNDKGKAKDISHISLYYSETSLTTVPLPAALPLYAAGMALLGLFGWKRSKA